MANFHPKSHQNADNQLNQSLAQLPQALAAPSDLPSDLAQPWGQLPAAGQSPETDVPFDWEAALELAAADIDNYFSG